MFCGMGGFSLGFQHVFGDNLEIIGACEIDLYACAVYRKHFPGVGIHDDATELVPRRLREFDILTGGWPCQGNSIAGKRAGHGDSRSGLFSEIIRILNEKRPRYFLLENVPGLFSVQSGQVFAEVLRQFASAGYEFGWEVLNSKNFGVPQNRQRIFFFGQSVECVRNEGRIEIFPLRDDATDAQQADCARQSEGASSITASSRGDLRGTHIVSCLDANYYKGISPSGHQSKRRTHVICDNPGVHQDYRVFGTDGVAPSLNANRGERKGRQKSMGGRAIRRFTPLESERLQGFPDGWTACGIDGDGKPIAISDTQRYKMCGNAVTVPVISAIASVLKEAIEPL